MASTYAALRMLVKNWIILTLSKHRISHGARWTWWLKGWGLLQGYSMHDSRWQGTRRWCFWHPVQCRKRELCGHVSWSWKWWLSLNGINTVPQSLPEAALTWFLSLDAQAISTTVVARAASYPSVQWSTPIDHQGLPNLLALSTLRATLSSGSFHKEITGGKMTRRTSVLLQTVNFYKRGRQATLSKAFFRSKIWKISVILPLIFP